MRSIDAATFGRFGILILLSVGCDSSPAARDAPLPVGDRVQANGFVLQVSLPSATWASTDDIPVSTTLTWEGAAPEAKIWGSGSGIVALTFTEVGSRHRSMGGVQTSDCRPFAYTRGVPTDIPAGKSVGYTEEDPNAAFYQTWYNEPGLHLPVGHWRLGVTASGLLAQCTAEAPRLDLSITPVDLFIR
jgi:hypothetical protein